ncbi:MAG: DUF6151 family protein [Erythrobacter sp.]|uniref:DUF6151 family protein n=1 Tax=Erythrobacter sp. TaxID=1042 RepID=UPI0025EB9FE2|nr:DUF6151 family protein [Erythrobacter sp.]MCM0000215.1 DUF6151 family protein [Erythrobacter sp.]
MTDDLHFACDCGAVAVRIALPAPVDGECVVCHCSDCRDFVRLCGKADRMAGPLGGLALFNFRGSRLEIVQGRERMASLHMTDKPVLRWFASCCQTPLFNSFANNRVPFLDICIPAIRNPEALGSLRAGERHLFTKSATGDASGMPKTSLLGLILRTTPRLLKEILSGQRRCNPLFDAATHAPIAVPRRVSPEERAALP